MDTCLSNFVQMFTEGHYYSYDLERTAVYYRGYERIMAHWRAVLPVAMHEVDYEALLDDQEAESRRLVEYLGLEWDPRCLRFHETQRDVRTASNWQVRQPLYRSSRRRWKRFEPWLAQLRADLGYTGA
jgi:hypothetical protein